MINIKTDKSKIGHRRIDSVVDGTIVLTLQDNIKCPFSGVHTWRISHIIQLPTNIKDASEIVKAMNTAFNEIKE